MIKKKISLIESLTGTAFNLKHLNGHEVTIKTDKMIKNKDQLRVENLGMPLYNETFSFGDLYVEFEVIYPKSFTD